MENNSRYFIFDLDDTLFDEVDFLESGFKEIVKAFPIKEKRDKLLKQMIGYFYEKKDVFKWLDDVFKEQLINCNKEKFLEVYRNHVPKITLKKDARELLNKLKKENLPIGLLTDGRSITQRNKIRALGIDGFFNDIIISEEFGTEKPNAKNYLFFSNKYPGHEFYFIGDNTGKDFIVPKQLEWKIFCLRDNGKNIHEQDLTGFKPNEVIDSLSEIQI